MIRGTTFFSVLFAALAGVGLFVVKNQVQSLEVELTRINREIREEREDLHVLRAEWSHLNEPGRLEMLASKYLELIPLEAIQFLSEDNISEVINHQNGHEISINKEIGITSSKSVIKRSLGGVVSE